jgi:hypothetical protein
MLVAVFLQTLASDAERTWFMSCTCPVMRATCVLLLAGVHRNMVWSSDPLTNRSGWPRTTASYRCCATCSRHTRAKAAAAGVRQRHKTPDPSGPMNRSCTACKPCTVLQHQAPLDPLQDSNFPNRTRAGAARPSRRTCIASCGSAGALPVWSNAPDRSTASVLSANVLTQWACPLSVRTSLPSAADHTLMQQSLLLL